MCVFNLLNGILYNNNDISVWLPVVVGSSVSLSGIGVIVVSLVVVVVPSVKVYQWAKPMMK